MDYREVQGQCDYFPISQINDCMDCTGKAKCGAKFDLIKGYWQVALTEESKEISAFVNPDGLYA